jgi:ArsR family transcriptional regulator
MQRKVGVVPMIEPNRLRQLIGFRCSPLLDMALSLLVIQNPESFGQFASWVPRVAKRLPQGLVESLRTQAEQTDLFALALELEAGPSLSVPEALRQLAMRDATLAAALSSYWEAIAPEVADRTGQLAQSLVEERARLEQMDPLAFICRFSDRVSVAGDGEAIMLHWGGGMRVPLADLERILFVPSAFSPRRLMFYRVGGVQIFFYDPQPEEPTEVDPAPESLVLAFSALADHTRLKLLRLVTTGSLPAQEMARRLGINESTVSRHLRLLVEAGLVARERQEGKFIIYGLQAGRIAQLAAGAEAYLGREQV